MYMLSARLLDITAGDFCHACCFHFSASSVPTPYRALFTSVPCRQSAKHLRRMVSRMLLL